MTKEDTDIEYYEIETKKKDFKKIFKFSGKKIYTDTLPCTFLTKGLGQWTLGPTFDTLKQTNKQNKNEDNRHK